MSVRSRTTRRAILGGAALALVAATAAFTVGPTAREAHPETTAAVPADNWLKGLNGKHKQFFDSPAPAGGIVLVHIMNYYDTWNKAYGVADKDIDAVGTFYGATTFYGVNDASGKPATVNPWRTAPVILGMTLAPASIEALQKRGATFILCNNALTIFSGILAQKRGLDPKEVYEDLKANILPGVELIPGMVVAVEQAQAAGLAYHRQ